MSALTYTQAIVIGALQGVTELFPVSSLGHSVLVPAWIGGSWQNLVTQGDSDTGTPYLAFVVGLHVATALALLVFYWRDWVGIIAGLITSVRTRKIETSAQRLGWLIVVATIPVGLLGLLLEHSLRTLFAKPSAAAVFLFINGLLLAGAEVLRRRQVAQAANAHNAQSPKQIADLSYVDAGTIGVAQSLALLAGISRSGVAMVGGLLRGLDHEDSAKFAFLLATPVILAAGVLKLPTLAGPQGDGILGQVVVGSLVAAVAAYLAVRFLTKYFHTRTLIPFAVYCLLAGAVSMVHFL
ncbi:undecaprenyl-diphosphate phosphatase [Mycobacteroides immunogenum]|uniref:Undecaprenyl-diphosphatase n=1 Tax=Mycobacteroides immunogenum TaxID=83262 RepID=A0A7V8LLY1_9MYCO|nr:undecaprenyl-diphosphate phosphatase [Mycobacteroides immunogenum]AMT71094.1 UDP pyrophosphate phosphatase [Mycobacteroides immunogenum]ANO04201.1 undecaprenyl-diphosphatase [Mycobacteroides immunogenum]KIU39093.1 UDP pyrophosphate phosphatase [Mycobacteroides immunogenum]KPG04984.1 UDP pyrophosphate phosphatase [Mycobacteroides immunogenum]KPG06763.1 UDP pyrophosphate phosphatase [Mycobacteroides immunogenum]